MKGNFLMFKGTKNKAQILKYNGSEFNLILKMSLEGESFDVEFDWNKKWIFQGNDAGALTFTAKPGDSFQPIQKLFSVNKNYPIFNLDLH
jgi:DNA repair ATPase RecN